MFNFTSIALIIFIFLSLFMVAILWKNYMDVENFTTLQSTQLLSLMNQHLQSEQELSRNITSTAQAEVDEGQRDLDQATMNELTAKDQLTKAMAELDLRKSNLANVQSTLSRRIPPS